MAVVSFTEGKQILLYSRDSLDRWYAANTESGGAWQQEFIRRLAHHGFQLDEQQIVGVHCETGNVARDAPYARYPQLLLVQARIQRHEANAVWVSEWARLPVLMHVQEEFFARVWAAGGEVIVGHHPVLQDKPEDPYRADFRQFIRWKVEAELVSIRHARRLKLRTMAAAQHFTGGATSPRRFGHGSTRPYGLTWEIINPVLGKHDYVPVPHEQEIIREMCEFRRSGVNNADIARLLNARGEPTVTGVPWVRETVRQILRRGPFEEARQLRSIPNAEG